MKIHIMNRRYGGMLAAFVFALWGAWAKAASTPASSNLRSALDSALVEYCIPKCDSNCNDLFKATYTAGQCACGIGDWMRYIKDKRECVMLCPTGTYLGTECPSWTYRKSGGSGAPVSGA
ncbi:MAG: hypothetical protein LBO78_01730 [Rickettsiales bacterium]|jgi:hypothetical protein|nr:hypothetical protein [Rickettsiales bacterium]